MENSVAFVSAVMDTWLLLVRIAVNFVKKRPIIGSAPRKYFKDNVSGFIQMSEHTTPAIHSGLSTCKRVLCD